MTFQSQIDRVADSASRGAIDARKAEPSARAAIAQQKKGA